MKKRNMAKPDRLAVTTMLNQFVIGFMEGSSDGIRRSIIDRLSRSFGLSVLETEVTVLYDNLKEPTRRCLSVHVDHAGEHYESVLVNLMYDTGYEDLGSDESWMRMTLQLSPSWRTPRRRSVHSAGSW